MSGSVLSLLRGGSAVSGHEGLLDGMSGASDTIDALDRGQITFHDVHHLVLADSQPVIVTAVESVRPGQLMAVSGAQFHWGSRGRRFKSGRPDQKVQVRRGSGFGLGPLSDLREPIGEPPESHIRCAMFVAGGLARRAFGVAALPLKRSSSIVSATCAA
jgi:hypothetical protein